MRFISLSLLISGAILCAQPLALPAPAPMAAPAEPSPDTVIASFEGKTLTYGQLREFITAMAPPEQQPAMLQNLSFSVHRYFFFQRLADLAQKEKLDQKSPTREQLYWDRINILAQSKLNDASNQTVADEDDLKKYYADNKDKYTQVRVKTIYISFSANPEAAGTGGKKVLNEAEAKAKITKILAEIRGGADFVKMVKQHSEDETSRAKDGDLETFRKSDEIPDAIRAEIFKLKRGEVSEPVRQPNGYYLFRAEEVTFRAYQQVQGEIYDIMRQINFKKWLDQMDKSVNVKIENPAVFKPTAPAPPAAPAPK
jgi:peptidyl-prolyl cis-trans isomerase C